MIGLHRAIFGSAVPVVCGLLVACALAQAPSVARAAKGFEKLDQLSTERWGLLRETEKYQLQIAEKYFLQGNYAVAAGEYEKFITLYETSEGAPYAQLKWSLCQVATKKLNTAVKDGFQTVIDYWPDSPEAVAAAYKIGESYKAMGEIAKAKDAYQKVLEKHADEMVAVLARFDLAELARIEQDRPRRIAILKELITGPPRVGDAGRKIADASEMLSELQFEDGAFVEGLASLTTSFQEPTLSSRVSANVQKAIRREVAVAETQERGLKTADAAINYLNGLRPAVPKDDAEKLRSKDLAYNVVDVHEAAQRSKEAGDTYEKLLAEFPDDDVINRYGEFLRIKGRYEERRNIYGRMKDQIRGQGLIAYSYRQENKPLLAIPIYEQLLTKDAAKAGTWQMELGHAYQAAGKYKEAIAAFQQSDSMPTNLHYIASCYRALKQWREAIGMYTQIAGAYPNEAAGALYQIARTHEDSGQAESAIATFQQVCKRYPTTEQARDAHQHLNNKYKILVTLGGAKAE